MRNETISIYHFNELSEEAQEKALEKLRDINVDHDWWDCTYDDVRAIGDILGFDIQDIEFRGFWSQGDGARFSGRYTPKTDCASRIKEYAPQDSDLHSIAQNLDNLIKTYGEFWSAKISPGRSPHYVHEMNTDIDLSAPEDMDDETFTALEESITEISRDFMRWIYSRLEKEYDYFTSRESIVETILANEYEFTEEGDIY